MLNAFTVDVEDYYHVSGLATQVHHRHWDQYPSRVVASTRRVLDLLQRHHVKGTFFVLGWVADRFPGLVREIAAAGHELGCHSYWHRLIYQQTPSEFREDLRQARSAIENAGGAEVTAYRAPSFSIVRRTLWALEILREEGFRVDSSIFPIHHDRYGIADAPRGPHRRHTKAGELWELPPLVYRVMMINLPVSGGGYFRLYPRGLTAFCFRKVNARGEPGMFYIHPWELDPDQPRMHGSAISRARHYVNLRSTEDKLDWFLPQFRFGRARDVLLSLEQSPEIVPGIVPEPLPL